MARPKKKTTDAARKAKAHAHKALVARRVDDVLRIRLDGAAFWDLCEFVREKESEPGSAWELTPPAPPMSDSQVRRYAARADALIAGQFEADREKLVALHAARRENLYAKATLSADYRTALSCLRDLAELQGLYPGTKHVVSGPEGKPIEAKVTHDVSDLLPSAAAVAAFVQSALARPGLDGGPDPEVRQDGAPQPVDPLRPQ